MPARPFFTHLINPFRAQSGSEHDVAQRMTLASIRTAIDYAKARGTAVDLVAACYEEDIPAVEPPARLLPLLHRSVQDISPMTPVRKFPLIGDLLQTAAANSDGEYLVYTNIDIILQPYFYSHVAKLLQWLKGYAPALVINRRRVSMATDPADLPRLYAEDGQPHLGFDCFVFPRSWVSDLELGTLCIGTHLFDSVLFAMLDLRSGFRTRCMVRQRLTLHMGDDGTWQRLAQYKAYNEAEARRLMDLAKSKMKAPAPRGSEFDRRDRFIQPGDLPQNKVPLPRKITWRLIEELSLRQTRGLLAKYLRTIPQR